MLLPARDLEERVSVSSEARGTRGHYREERQPRISAVAKDHPLEIIPVSAPVAVPCFIGFP
jgi:hypothetical protein